MPDDIVVTPPTTEVAGGSPGAGGDQDQGIPSYMKRILDEWKDERREHRKIINQSLDVMTKFVSPPQPATQAKPVAQAETPVDSGVSALAAELAKIKLELAMSANGVSDEITQELLRKAAQADKPSDYNEFVKKYAPKPTVAAKPPVTVVDSGPPVSRQPGVSLPSNPYDLPPEVVARMSPAEVRKALDDHFKGTGRGVNVYKDLLGKRPHERANKN